VLYSILFAAFFTLEMDNGKSSPATTRPTSARVATNLPRSRINSGNTGGGRARPQSISVTVPPKDEQDLDYIARPENYVGSAQSMRQYMHSQTRDMVTSSGGDDYSTTVDSGQITRPLTSGRNSVFGISDSLAMRFVSGT